MTIMYVTGYSDGGKHVEGFNAAAHELGHDLTVLTASISVEHYCSKKSISSISITSIENEYFSYDRKDHKKYEDKWNISSLKSLVWPDQCYADTGKKYLIAAAIKTWHMLEALQDDERPDLIIQKPGAEVHRRVAAIWARHHRIQHRILGSCPIPNRTILHFDEQHRLDEINKDWRTSIGDYEKEVKKFIEWMRKEKPVYKYGAGGNTRTSIFRRKYINVLRKIKSENAYYSLRRKIVNKVKNLFTLKPKSLATKNIYNRCETPDKYIFFPLHVSFDSQITVRNPQFFDQLQIVKRVCRCIPSDFSLVVKAHPGITGALSFRTLRDLKNNDKIFLADPRLNAHSIIDNADGVVIISSTVGFESIVRGTPIVYLGKWTFQNLIPEMKSNDDMYLSENINRLVKANKVSENKIRKFVCGTYISSRPGSINSNKKNYTQIVEGCLESADTARKQDCGWPKVP